MTAIDLRLSSKDPVLSPLYALLKQGRYAALRKRASRQLKKYPTNARLYGFLGAACAGSSDLDAGIGYYQRALQLDGSDASLHQDLGKLFYARADYPRAVTCFINAKKHGAEGPELAFHLGISLMRLNRLREALSQLAMALSAEPENAEYAARLAEAFEQGGYYEEARKCFEIACSLAAENFKYQVALARCCYAGGDADRALLLCDQALASGSKSAEIHTIRAAALAALGRLDEASQASRNALSDKQAAASHFYNFAVRHNMATEPDIVGRVMELLHEADGSSERRALHFAMAKVREDLDEIDQAYEHLVQGNALRKAELKYDIAHDMQLFASLKQTFRGAAHKQCAFGAEITPVFIVGMPRSGTTLAEAILARHTEVTACGELNALLQSLVVAVPDQGIPTDAEGALLAQTYIDHLPPHARNSKFVTDKMPENFKMIGHILMSMPNAKIVHMCRDPKAVCWSNFKTSFSSKGNGFCYDPEDLVTYYKGYSDLMAFWHLQFPNKIFDLNYEALVENPEPEIRKLTDYVGLSWEEACLTPQKGQQMVTTASQVQVRRAIYKGSSEAWRRYEAQAGHWLAKL